MELRNASRFIPRESMMDKDGPTFMTEGEWQAVRGNSLVTSVQFGRFDNSAHFRGLAPGKQSTRDIGTTISGAGMSRLGRCSLPGADPFARSR